MEITIRTATADQAAELSEIAFQSKGYWGYDKALLEQWRTAFLTFTPQFIRDNQVWVAVVDGTVAGFAAIKEEHDTMVLDDLWVLPTYIGQGIGKRLFQHVAAHVPEFTFTADPHADNFYYKMGAEKIGEQESTLQGRMLTVFRYSGKATSLQAHQTA